MKGIELKAMSSWSSLFALILPLVSCTTEQVEPEPGKTADCEYYFLNDPIGNCGFDFDTLPYCEECPDEEGKLGTYNILIDQPNDSYSDAVPLRPTILAVHGYGPNSSEPKDPYAGLFLPSMRNNFCKFGYTIASLEYRQDIKGFSDPVCDIPVREVIKTHYRAIQDLRKALDVLYQNPIPYGVDIDNLFLLGNSMGAMAVLNGLLTTNADEWLATFPAEYHDIKNELGPWMTRRPIKGIIAIAGPLYDLNLFETSDNTPMFLAHGVCDNTVPYKSGTFFDCQTEIAVHGAYDIACRANDLGKPYSLHSINGLGHDYTEEVNDMLREKIRDWVRNQIICGEPIQEEFTTEANEVICSSTSTSTMDCQ